MADTLPELDFEQRKYLHHLLVQWFDWCHSQKGGAWGYPPATPWAHRQTPYRWESYVSQQIDLEVDLLPLEHRAALGQYLLIKTQQGVRIKPQAPNRMHRLYNEALCMLYKPLKRRGVLPENF